MNVSHEFQGDKVLKIWPSSLETLLFSTGCSTLVIKERHRSVCHIFAFLFSENKSLRDDEVLQNLLAGTTVTVYFRDLGPQISWTKVRNGHWFCRDAIQYIYIRIQNIDLNIHFWYVPESKILPKTIKC